MNTSAFIGSQSANAGAYFGLPLPAPRSMLANTFEAFTQALLAVLGSAPAWTCS